MAERRQSTRAAVVPVSTLAFLIAGCAGEDVSAGDVGNVVNASRCYGTACVNAVLGALPGVEPARCEASLSRRLVEDLRVQVWTGSVSELAVAPDGTIWVLHEQDFEKKRWLEHYGHDGALLGTSTHIDRGGPNAAARQHLAVDTQSRAWVATYLRVSDDAGDDDVYETLTLRVFGADGKMVRSAQSFHALAESFAHVNADGMTTLVGNRTRYEPAGSVLRLDGVGKLLWNQTALVVLGEAGGVTGLVVHDDGSATVLAARARSSSTSSSVAQTHFALSSFDAMGRPAGADLIPADLGLASPPELAAGPGKSVVVSGVRGGEHLVQSFPADGSAGFAYLLPGGLTSLAVDRATGNIYSQTANGVGVITANGAACGIAPLVAPVDPSWMATAGLEFSNGALYYADSWAFGRWRWE
jgi:hypothetical protein